MCLSYLIEHSFVSTVLILLTSSFYIHNTRIFQMLQSPKQLHKTCETKTNKNEAHCVLTWICVSINLNVWSVKEFYCWTVCKWRDTKLFIQMSPINVSYGYGERQWNKWIDSDSMRQLITEYIIASKNSVFFRRAVALVLKCTCHNKLSCLLLLYFHYVFYYDRWNSWVDSIYHCVSRRLSYLYPLLYL